MAHNSRNNGDRSRGRDRDLRDENDVPFKDFLLYLYQSATPSPASTREGSISRGYRNRQQTNHQQLPLPRNQHHVAVAQSLERIQGKSKTQMLVEVGSSSPKKDVPSGNEGKASVPGASRIVIHHQQGNGVVSKSKKPNNDPTPVTASLRRRSISPDKTKHSSVLSRTNSQSVIAPQRPKPQQVPSKQDQPNSSTTKPSNDNIKTINTATNRKKEDIAPKPPSLSVTPVQSKTKITNKSPINDEKHGHESLPPLVASKGNVRKSSHVNGTESRNQSPASSYREVLGEFSGEESVPVINKKQEKSKSSSQQKRVIVDHNNEKSDAIADTTHQDHDPREEMDPNLNHLCVHPDHDLSFFKNFSATASRSKSSLAEWSLIRGIESHQPLCPSCLYAHQYQFYDQTNGHNSSTHQICCNCNYQNHLHTTTKRHSRSTPIALDVVNARNNETLKKNYRQKGDHFHLPVFDHQHLLDYEQFSDERELLENEDDNQESKHTSQSDGDDKPGSGPGNKSQTTKQGSSHSVRENLEESMLRNSTSPLFSEVNSSRSTKSTTEGVRRVSHVPLSKSRPTLGVNDTEENMAVAINTSNPVPAGGGHDPEQEDGMAVVLPRKRGGGNNIGVTGPGTTTTLTLKMDTNSVFMDTVYVNLKQDIDTGSSIKVFY